MYSMRVPSSALTDEERLAFVTRALELDEMVVVERSPQGDLVEKLLAVLLLRLIRQNLLDYDVGVEPFTKINGAERTVRWMPSKFDLVRTSVGLPLDREQPKRPRSYVLPPRIVVV
jgi:hypothetical protein